MHTHNLFFYNLNELSWNDLPWKEIRIYVFEVQTKIYRASYKRETIALKNLQEIMLQDYSVRLLALNIVANYQFVKKN